MLCNKHYYYYIYTILLLYIQYYYYIYNIIIIYIQYYYYIYNIIIIYTILLSYTILLLYIQYYYIYNTIIIYTILLYIQYYYIYTILLLYIYNIIIIYTILLYTTYSASAVVSPCSSCPPPGTRTPCSASAAGRVCPVSFYSGLTGALRSRTAGTGGRHGISGQWPTCVTIPGQQTGRKERFYLTTHSTHFIYGYMASDIW